MYVGNRLAEHTAFGEIAHQLVELLFENACDQVKSIRSDQFVQVPRLANPDQVTLQEEDKITAFYGGGTMYAMPDRKGPWL